jgi:polyhydroxybutyrate depolymerase
MRKQTLLLLLVVAACKSGGGFSPGDDATDEGGNGGGNAGASSGSGGGTTSSSGGEGTSSSGGSSGGATSGSGGTTAGSKVDVSTETVTAAGLMRSYVLAKPKSFDPAKKYPVVLAFHGDGEDAAGIRAYTHWDDFTGDDALVVYPETRPSDSWDLYTPMDTNVDDAFAVALVADLATRFGADTSRVFGWGFSSGAFIINQLACRRTGFFRAIAPNSGGAPAEPQDPNASTWDQPYYVKCAGQTGGVAAFIVHGNTDDTVDVESGNFDAQYWSHINGCNDDRDARLAATPSPCKKAPSCPAGMDVYYCEIPNMGHSVWSDGAKASWAFFKTL